MRRSLIAAGATCLLAGQASATETITYKYDALGRLIQSFKDGGAATGTLTNTSFDAADNRSNYAVANTVRILHAGDRIYSADNRFYLTLLANGDLTIIVAAGGSLWSSGTSGQTVDRATFQADGNLVLYSPTNTIVWQSASNGNPAALLAMQNDGNLTITSQSASIAWQSNTGGH